MEKIRRFAVSIDYRLAPPSDPVFFIGSSATGKMVMKAAFCHLSPVSPELGGKSPALLGEVVRIIHSQAGAKSTCRKF